MDIQLNIALYCRTKIAINQIHLFLEFLHLISMETNKELREGMKIELLQEIPGIEKGTSGTITKINYVDYTPTDIDVVWIGNKNPVNFDLSYEPNILDKVRIVE